MGTAERRLEILKYLCRKRYCTMPQLAREFGVCVRTIQRDIYEIELVFRAPLQVKSGKHGGIWVMGNYTLDRVYMCEEEIALLQKIRGMVGEGLTPQEMCLFGKILENYTKPEL